MCTFEDGDGDGAEGDCSVVPADSMRKLPKGLSLATLSPNTFCPTLRDMVFTGDAAGVRSSASGGIAIAEYRS